MKKIIVITVMILFAFVSAHRVFAHTLKIDGNIGINLHVDPDDAPIAGAESKFLIDIQDKSGRFNPDNPTNCDCKLTIFQKDTALKTMSVISAGTYAQLRYTFPSSGVYTVTVEGKPKGEGIAFQSFKTTFEYFVKPAAAEASVVFVDKNPLREYAPYIALAVGLIIIVMFVL